MDVRRLQQGVADIDLLLEEVACPEGPAAMLRALPTLIGDVGVLGRAREVLAGAPAEVGAAIAELEAVARLAECRAGGIELYFDLAELRGYNYHRGVLFSAYAADHARTVAGGGRYDGVGSLAARGPRPIRRRPQSACRSRPR